MLVDGDLAGYGLLGIRGPDADMFEVSTIEFFLLGLDNDPPVRVSVLTLLK